MRPSLDPLALRPCSAARALRHIRVLRVAFALHGSLADIVNTGGIVLVPEEGMLSVYNFHELQNLEPSRLMKLGLPMPAVPVVPPQLTLFQKLQMLGFDTSQ